MLSSLPTAKQIAAKRILRRIKSLTLTRDKFLDKGVSTRDQRMLQQGARVEVQIGDLRKDFEKVTGISYREYVNPSQGLSAKHFVIGGVALAAVVGFVFYKGKK